jgi:hypothetical protein
LGIEHPKKRQGKEHQKKVKMTINYKILMSIEKGYPEESPSVLF